MNTKTIEDCLELLVGFQNAEPGKFTMKKEDYTILTSIGRQTVRGIGLTDRQHALLKTKLVCYNDMYDPTYTILDNQRILKKIRQKNPTLQYNNAEELVIAVKFISQQKLINAIEKAKSAPHSHMI